MSKAIVSMHNKDLRGWTVTIRGAVDIPDSELIEAGFRNCYPATAKGDSRIGVLNADIWESLVMTPAQSAAVSKWCKEWTLQGVLEQAKKK